jgi:hypothetical protein
MALLAGCQEGLRSFEEMTTRRRAFSIYAGRVTFIGRKNL